MFTPCMTIAERLQLGKPLGLVLESVFNLGVIFFVFQLVQISKIKDSTSDKPLGGKLVVVANDISFQSGSFAIEEDAVPELLRKHSSEF